MASASKSAPDYVFVDTAPRLAEVCDGFRGATRLAVDTEFVGEKYFYPRLEVLQISDGKRIALVDAPAIRDLSPVAELVADKNSLKLFHAASQDLEILQRVLGVAPRPLFDTQVAASLLGYGAQISLANLVQQITGAEVGSKHTTSDWSHRPLSPEQLAYAAEDVLYLHKLHEVLHADLTARGRLAWFEEEQAERVDAILDPPEPDRAEAHRLVKDWMSLKGRELAILRELSLWREEAARSRDLPRRTVFTDDGLIEIARFQPRDREAVKRLRRINPGQAFRYYDEWQKVLERGLKVPKEQWPRKPEKTAPDLPVGLVELALALLRSEAEKQHIAATLLATTSEIQSLVTNRANIDELTHPLLHGWRRELVGGKLVRLLRGEITVRVGAGGDLEFVEG